MPEPSRGRGKHANTGWPSRKKNVPLEAIAPAYDAGFINEIAAVRRELLIVEFQGTMGREIGLEGEVKRTAFEFAFERCFAAECLCRSAKVSRYGDLGAWLLNGEFLFQLQLG